MTSGDPRTAVPLDWLTALQAWLDETAARAAGPHGSTGAPRTDGHVDGLAREDEVRLARATAVRLSLPATAEPGRQLVVLGPTQAGKSTVVNRLLDVEVAGVSALAGHTVHAQAFVPTEDGARARERLPILLEPLRAVAREALDRTVLDTWSLQGVTPGAHALAPRDATVWDTPDFDSIAATGYREAVTLASALADAIVLVVSKDKYADRSVWQRLQTLRALGTPLVLVVNKVEAASRDTIARALEERLAGSEGERTADKVPVTVLLPWVDRPGDDAPLVLPEAARRELASALDRAWDASTDRGARRAALQRFVAARCDDWLAPLRTEQASRERWHDAIDEGARELVDGYERRWLAGDEHGDAFDRTLVELLALLEVPGIARVLQRTRQAVTWPARRLLGLGLGTASRLARGAGSRFGVGVGVGGGAQATTPAARERRVLDELLDKALTGWRERVMDERDGADGHGFWRELDAALVATRPELQRAWGERTEAMRAAFQPRIDAAARQLYERLQTQPALLNTLRATRIGTDAAGVALAIKSGGMAPADLVLAPAMLSVTTLLTESALGRYLDGVRRELERAQKRAVEQDLVEALLVPTLRALAPGAGAATDPDTPDGRARAALQEEVAASRERIANDRSPPPGAGPARDRP